MLKAYCSGASLMKIQQLIYVLVTNGAADATKKIQTEF